MTDDSTQTDTGPVYYSCYSPNSEQWVWVYRASGLDGCIKMLVDVRSGVTPAEAPDWMLERYQEGRDNEHAILQALADGNVKGRWGKWKMLSNEDPDTFRDAAVDTYIEYGQIAFVKMVGEGVVMAGHLDGMAELLAEGQNTKKYDLTPGDRVVVEAKFLGPDLFKRWKSKGVKAAMPYYYGQSNRYAYAMGAKGTLLLVGEKIVHEKGDTDRPRVIDIGEVHAEYIPLDPKVWMNSIIRIHRVERAANGYPDDGIKCDVRMFPCPVYYLGECESKSDEQEVVILSGEDADNLRAIAELREKAVKLGAESDLAKEQAKKAMIALAERLGKEPGARYTAGDLSVVDVSEDIEESTRTVKAHTRRYPKVVRGGK